MADCGMGTHPGQSALPPPPHHATDAYERLILDCVNGDRRLFIRNDELEVAWEKFTPVLQVWHDSETKKGE